MVISYSNFIHTQSKPTNLNQKCFIMKKSLQIESVAIYVARHCYNIHGSDYLVALIYPIHIISKLLATTEQNLLSIDN